MDTTIALIITYMAVIIFMILLKRYFYEIKNKREQEILKNIKLAFLVENAENNIEGFVKYLENNNIEIISKFDKIIFINDNSKDDSFDILEKLSRDNDYIEIRENLAEK